MKTNAFSSLRPYFDEEINAAMHRIASDPLLYPVVQFLYPDTPIKTFKENLKKIDNIFDFQKQVMDSAIKTIVKKTMTAFSWNGTEHLEKNKAYLFVSNHRDILLDSALLQIILLELDFKTSEITFGSNLMKPQFVVDIGKSNKMFKVERGGSPRDFYANSKHLSDYIRHTLLHKKESVWIAQRNGRTKDGNDLTDIGILKMFAMSGSDNILENLGELNIVPLSISYQYEPCDILKMKELYASRKEKYIKAPNEDLQSIITGIMQPKGNVHIQCTKPITIEALSQYADLNKKDIYTTVKNLIDKQIHEGYRLYNTNFMAYDILNNSKHYIDKEYTADERNNFTSSINKQTDKLQGEKNELKKIFFEIYANPLKAKLKIS